MSGKERGKDIMSAVNWVIRRKTKSTALSDCCYLHVIMSAAEDGLN